MFVFLKSCKLIIQIVVSDKFTCLQSSCNLYQLPTIPCTLTAYVDLESVMVVTGWIMLQALLAVVPIGFVTFGPTLADGKRLPYRNNG